MNFNINRGVLQSCILYGAAVCCKLRPFYGLKNNQICQLKRHIRKVQKFGLRPLNPRKTSLLYADKIVK